MSLFEIFIINIIFQFFVNRFKYTPTPGKDSNYFTRGGGDLKRTQCNVIVLGRIIVQKCDKNNLQLNAKGSF